MVVDTRYFTPQEAADVLGCDPEQVLHWIHSGQLPATNVAKSPNGQRPRWRIPESDLGKFLISRRNTPPAPPAKKQIQRIPKNYV